MASLLEALLNLVFPARPDCKLCGRKHSKEEVCSHCLQDLNAWSSLLKCSHCGRPLSAGEVGKHSCSFCSLEAPPFVKAIAAGPYQGSLKEAIHLFKYCGRKSLAPILADLMVRSINSHKEFLESRVVIPVPTSPKRLRERGFNQAELLATHLARRLKLPLLSQTVVKDLETPHQTGLNREQRQQNLRGAFRVTAPTEVKDKSILIVDDVLTTAFTAATLTQTLTAAGSGPIYIITAARG